MTVFRTATLRTFFFAIHAGAKELDMKSQFFELTLAENRLMSLLRRIQFHINLTMKLEWLKKWLCNFFTAKSNNSSWKGRTYFSLELFFNKQAVSNYFNIVQKFIEKHNFDGSRVYNCDEIGVQTVQKSCSKVLRKRETRSGFAYQEQKEEKHLRLFGATNAMGNCVSPFFIFPRKIMNRSLMDRLSARSAGFCQQCGRMNSEMLKN